MNTVGYYLFLNSEGMLVGMVNQNSRCGTRAKNAVLISVSAVIVSLLCCLRELFADLFFAFSCPWMYFDYSFHSGLSFFYTLHNWSRFE